MLQLLYKYLATSRSPCPQFVDKKAFLASFQSSFSDSSLSCIVGILRDTAAWKDRKVAVKLMGSMSELASEEEEMIAMIKRQASVDTAQLHSGVGLSCASQASITQGLAGD